MQASQNNDQLAFTEKDQDGTIEFLRQPDAYPAPCQDVKVIETHAALVFLAGDEAYKIKKAVTYPYLDFSTLAKRKLACERELEINQPHAPQIYLDVLPICRLQDGKLQIGGRGEPVEWAVHMRRFDDDALLAKAAEQGSVGLAFYEDLADEIIRYHAAAPILDRGNGATGMDAIIAELCLAFEASENIIGTSEQTRFASHMWRRIDEIRHRLDQRASRGFVRRCHGDLHLQNIVVLDGRPVLFDAIEFNEDLATIDVLYDLAFLVMDLEARGMRAEANKVLNRYVVKSADSANIAGLQALPLFLACRAAIRAMVALTRMHQAARDAGRLAARKEALDYFRAAFRFLERRRPKLISVGGLSGTGKTTTARHLAPLTGRAPGALHLRSDVERKTLFAVEETHRLDASAYTAEIGEKIYARLMRKARLGLLAGSDVIVDAVFQDTHERDHAARTARRAGASFTGLWLDADERSMIKRISARKADASDATPDVVRQQLTKPTGPIDWHRIDAAGTADETLANCRQAMHSAN